MLGRRHRPTIAARLAGIVWPRGGWPRALRYWMYRIQRLPATPDRLAGGFAIGAGVSCLPYLGLHFVLAGSAAWLVRANVVASAIGTLFANPWTCPLIWWGSYRLGVSLGFDLMSDGSEIVDPGPQITAAFDALVRFDLAGMVGHAWPVLLPMTVGGAIIGAAVGVVSYLLLYPPVAAAQRRRQVRLQRARLRIAASLGLVTEGIETQ
jgi:uncharacterized protein (DUF2062 family)